MGKFPFLFKPSVHFSTCDACAQTNKDPIRIHSAELKSSRKNAVTPTSRHSPDKSRLVYAHRKRCK